jgi:acetyl esterase/lipase
MKEIRLNAFEMNSVVHQSPGLWTHPRDRAETYRDLEHWTSLARVLERGRFDGIFLADALGIYDVYGGSPAAILKHGGQVPVNDPVGERKIKLTQETAGERQTAMVSNRRAFIIAAAATAIAPSAHAGEGRVMDWEIMSLAERDAAFNNTAQVGLEIAKKITEEWVTASAALRAKHPGHLALPYAPGERTKWDLFPGSDPSAPCFVHIHGGYWQRNSRETFSCLAEGVMAHGWSAALPGYTLAPGASLTQITKELITALDWLGDQGKSHGIAGPIILSGWSAGGHLTAFLLDHPSVAAGLAISGVYELAPLRDSPSVNDKVKFTEEEIVALSPMRLPSPNKPLNIAYGVLELPGMIAMSRDYHAYRAHARLPGSLIPIVKAHHYTILNELRSPNSILTRAALQLPEDVKTLG